MDILSKGFMLIAMVMGFHPVPCLANDHSRYVIKIETICLNMDTLLQLVSDEYGAYNTSDHKLFVNLQPDAISRKNIDANDGRADLHPYKDVFSTRCFDFGKWGVAVIQDVKESEVWTFFMDLRHRYKKAFDGDSWFPIERYQLTIDRNTLNEVSDAKDKEPNRVVWGKKNYNVLNSVKKELEIPSSDQFVIQSIDYIVAFIE